MKQKPYQTQKDYLSQNIFTVYDFDMKFIYKLTRWEESAYDRRVLSNTIETKGF